MFPLQAGYSSRGEDIEVRLLEEFHANDLFRLINKNRAWLRQWLPWLDWSVSVADTADYIRESRKRSDLTNGFSAGVWVADKLSGSIGLHAVDFRHRSSNIGYWLAEERSGRGVMTRACRAVVNAGFQYYGLHRIEIRCATGNRRSCRIPERLGFLHEGVLRDAEWLYDHFVDLNVYSMLEQDWPAVSA